MSPSQDLETLSKEARRLVDEAVAIVEANVQLFGDGTLHVSGAGSEGPVMGAVRRLEEARALHPESAVLRFAHSSALAVAAQHQSARAEMHALAMSDPPFVLAEWALAGWERWRSLFVLAPWGPETQTLHPLISNQLIGCVLLAVRHGIVPRATLFFRDGSGNFPDLAALRDARIEIAGVTDSSSSATPVFAIFARVWDDPQNAFGLEAHALPLYPRGNPMRRALEHLATQNDIDFAVIDPSDGIMLNRRLEMPAKMRAAVEELVPLLDSGEEHEYSPSDQHSAIAANQARLGANTVEY